jgi:hypothetical protein
MQSFHLLRQPNNMSLSLFCFVLWECVMIHITTYVLIKTFQTKLETTTTGSTIVDIIWM